MLGFGLKINIGKAFRINGLGEPQKRERRVRCRRKGTVKAERHFINAPVLHGLDGCPITAGVAAFNQIIGLERREVGEKHNVWIPCINAFHRDDGIGVFGFELMSGIFGADRFGPVFAEEFFT